MTRPTSRSSTAAQTVKNAPPETTAGRERILDAALDVIARRGYSAAGVQEIVDLSETSKGSFYFHFPSKEKMAMALVDRMSEKLINRVQESVKNQPTPLHRVSASIDALLNVFARKRAVAQVLLLNIMGHGQATDKKFLPVREKFSRLIQKELDAAVECGQIQPVDTQLVSRIWVGGLQEIIMHWLLTGQDGPLISVAAPLRRILMQSVGADPAVVANSPES
jgi:AcrR family transcriptional regulator